MTIGKKQESIEYPIIMANNNFYETFFSFPHESAQTPYTVFAGITHPNPKYRIRRNETFNVYVLEYIVAGKGTLHYDSNTYFPKAQDVYLLQPQSEHEYFSDPHDPWEKLWFNIRGALPEALCNAYHLRGRIYFPDHAELRPFFEQGLEIIRQNAPDAQLELALCWHRIFANLAQAKASTDPSGDGMAMREYIQTHWRQGFAIADLVRLTGKSQAQVLRRFQQDWHCSPYVYLQRIRLEYARMYLENTVESIKHIAFLCGFEDELYFSNWFKKKQGCSPKQYRQQ